MSNTTIDFQKGNILLVDVSYYTYTRFFSTRIWYKNANKDEEIDLGQDWTLNEKFMEKFTKLYFSKIKIIKNKFNIPDENIIYAIDSPFSENWRLKTLEDYKGTRGESHKNNKFNSWDIFTYVSEKLLADKPNVYEVPGLEADDIVAIAVKRLKQLDPTSNANRSSKYYILATDKDYIQICNDRTFLIDSNANDVSSKNLSDCSNIDYLLKKIMLGDKSDNIPACFMTRKLIDLAGISSKKETLKCTPAKVDKIMETADSHNAIIQLLKLTRENKKEASKLESSLFLDKQFTKNSLIIDFAQIPNSFICKCKI